MKDKPLGREIAEAAADFDRMAAETHRPGRALRAARQGRSTSTPACTPSAPFDKTLLLLEGQKRAPVAIVRDAGMITLAAAFDCGIDFVELLELGGGMPTRVSIKEARLDEVLQKLNG